MKQQMIVVYVPCVDTMEAKKIGNHVLGKRLAPCYNIILNTYSAAFWPPKSEKIEEVTGGAVLLIKSVASKFSFIETEIKKLHSDSNPCIFSINAGRVSKEYYMWLLSEME